MKHVLLILVIGLYGCTPTVEKDFNKIPSNLATSKNLIETIKPSKEYIYWECVFKGYQKGSNIIISKGDSTSIKNLSYTVPQCGFITENWSGYYYIAYFDGISLKYAYDQKSLIQFIGDIKYLDQALLIAKTHNYSIDLKTKIGSSYKKSKNGYELYLAKFHSCPVKTEAFKILVGINGDVNAKTLNHFYDVDDSICLD